jgi:STE24 endopeptidase
MTATTLLGIFLGFYAFEFFCSWGLSFLNSRYVLRHQEEPPARYKAFISPEKYKAHVAYTLEKARFSRFSSGCESLIFLAFLFGGGFGKVEAWSSSLGWSSSWTGIAFIYGVSFIFMVVDIPFSLYRTFGIEEKYGFNKTTLKLYLWDMAKGLVLGLVLGTPLLFILLGFMEKTGGYWWIWAFGIMVFFQLFIAFIFPLFLAPLFNKFTPLEEGSLKEQIGVLADKLNFKNSGIFIMDGSKRSSHGNAYFTGFGSSKRIVLYDTLVQSLKPSEVLAVLAHEMGHCKLHHIKKSMVLSIVMMFFSFYVLSLCVPYTPFYSAFGISQPSHGAALLLFSLCSGPFTFFFTPLFSARTRKFEYEADAFAVRYTPIEDLSQGLLTLDKENLSNLWPHPWYSFFYYSHPTTLERIEALEKKQALLTPSMK